MITGLQRLTTFRALQDRNYRWYWLGMLASSATFQMGAVGQGWLVYDITGSALALGWVGAGWSISNSLLSPFAGVLSDRIDKRALILWMQGLMILSSLLISVLIAIDVIQVWHIAAFSLFRGILGAFLMPAQNAYLADLIDRKTLLNAVSLNSIGMGLAGIFSASAAGLLIDSIGVESVFFIITLLYVAVFITMAKLPSVAAKNSGSSSVLSDLADGIRYLRVSPVLIPLLALVFMRGLLAMPYQTLMPKYAEDVMGLDASGLGILVAAPGVGSLVSSLVMASMGDFQRKGRLLLAAGIVLGTGLVLFSNTLIFALVLVLLAIVGAASNTCMVINRTLLQAYCDPPYLGRLMSAYMMMYGLTGLGTIPIGGLADRFGTPAVTTALGALFVLAMAAVWLTQPRIRSLA